MKQVLYLVILNLSIGLASAEDHYVSQNGKASWSQCTSPGTTCSLSAANSNARAGDTVYMKGGSYSTPIQPSNSGNSNSSRIVYRNYADEEPIFQNLDTPVILSQRSYVTVSGITARNIDKYVRMNGGHHIVIEHSTFGPNRNYEDFEGFRVGPDASFNWIHHNEIFGYGEYTPTEDRGDMFYFGDQPYPGNTHHNLAEYNHMYHGGHNVFASNGRHNVIRNNHFHNEEWKEASNNVRYGGRIGGIRGVGGGKFNLIEGNRWSFSGIPPDNNYAPCLKIVSEDNIVRGNMFYHCKGPGVQIPYSAKAGPQGSDNNYIYNNVFFYNGLGPRGRYGIWFKSSKIRGCVVKNNIFSKNPGTVGGAGSNTVANNWESGDPGFVDADAEKTTDPFDKNYPDFNLKFSSPCINKGEFLTKTTNSGTHSTVIKVQDAHYFFDGWNMADDIPYADLRGDLIQLDGQTVRARITKIDYGTNTITVDTALTWTTDQGISLAYEGSAPDLGAIEFSGETSPCDCTGWQARSCGGTCPATQRKQTRACTPSGCNTESQCVMDPFCTSIHDAGSKAYHTLTAP